MVHRIGLLALGLAAGMAWGAEACAALDVDAAVEALAGARVAWPEDADRFWIEQDGLPRPGDAGFAEAAGGFLAANPIPPASDPNPALWDVALTVSRQAKCLTYLAGGSAESRRAVAALCITQARFLQWRLPVCSERDPMLDGPFCGGHAGLIALGSALRAASPVDGAVYAVATQWCRTGLGQLTTFDRRGSQAARKLAAAVIRAARVTPEQLAIHTSDQDFFAELDLTRPELAAVAQCVAAEDWPGAEAAYVEVLAQRFAKSRGWPDLLYEKDVDLPNADGLGHNVFLIRTHMYKRHDYGATIRWGEPLDGDIESVAGMNGHAWLLTLVNAYRATGDEKYVTHLCRLWNDWYAASPPTFARSSRQWRTLELGKRSTHWVPTLLNLAEHPTFRRACLFNFARSMLDHGKYASMYAKDGRNWAQVEASALLTVGLLFPEFKLAPLFREVGLNRLCRANANAFLPDGFQCEGSAGYLRFPLIPFGNAVCLARFLGAGLPDELVRQYADGARALAGIAYPDLTIPMLSDQNPRYETVAEMIATAGESLRLPELQWIASGGRRGQAPAATSRDFTHAGFCVMRDRWGPDGQVCILDAGAYGAGHQHDDKLNVVLHAHGRELIGDPGIYLYKRDAYQPYWRGSWSHNTITIDDLSQDRRIGPPEAMPDPDRRFVMADGFDFAVGRYRGVYGLRDSERWRRPADDPARRAGGSIRGVEHQRCVFYLHGQYAVVCDRVTGPGRHQVDVLYHPAPVLTGKGIASQARAVRLAVLEGGQVCTQEDTVANIAILPPRGHDAETLIITGQKDPVRGWYALYGLVPSPDVIFRHKDAELPVQFETVLYPSPAGKTTPPEVERVALTGPPGQACAGLNIGRDLFMISHDGPAGMRAADVEFEGTALLLHRDERGRAVRAYAVDGRRLVLAGRPVEIPAGAGAGRVLELAGRADAGPSSSNGEVPNRE